MTDELTIGLSAIPSICLFHITKILTHFENAFLVCQIFPPRIQSFVFKRLICEGNKVFWDSREWLMV